ncbi:dihydrolipoyl dehydrogenase [Pseudalkalibacillus sp. A8]|uniref:dihydrolipoyl dehydrogenase n=1 Tax=Pseudalkalibacillus sp. A8 TaxID=3382641 RepID=UPI0038B52C2D
MKHYDTVVVGGGPGGYVAAEEAAKYGHSVGLVEMKHLGGTCLNTGCIPSKTLLRHSEALELMEKARQWGIEYTNVSVSFDKMMQRKDTVIKSLRQGVASLLQKEQVDIYNGKGTIHQDHRISIESDHGTDIISARNIIVATGSKPFIPLINGVDETTVHTSDTIFELDHIPKSLVIIGGGIIGVEFACIFSSLDVEVTIIEMENRLIAGEDEDASELITKKLKKDSVNIFTSAKVQAASETVDGKEVHLELEDGKRLTLECEEILLASGRTPNLSACTKLNLQMNGSFIAVNHHMETSMPNIYAIGDVIGGWQLAHVASAEGIVAAANASGHDKQVDYKVVPRCIYTLPEIASVGLTEKEAMKKGYTVRTETIPLGSNGKAFAMDEKNGFVKLIAEETFDEILGIVMVGPHVTEMISEASSFITLEGTVQELASLIHPHPTLSEGIWEVAKRWLAKKKQPITR